MKKYIALLILLPTLCFAQGAHRISQILVKGNGIDANVSPYAKILVCVANTACATAANIYLDAALTSPAHNPLTADGAGNYDYYLASGCVDESITNPGSAPIFLSNVCPFNGTGGGGSSCGPLGGDATSTNCGNNNLSGNTATNVQTFGYTNGNTIPDANKVMVGAGNMSAAAVLAIPKPIVGVGYNNFTLNSATVDTNSTNLFAFGINNFTGGSVTPSNVHFGGVLAMGDTNVCASQYGTTTIFDSVYIGESNGCFRGSGSVYQANILAMGDTSFNLAPGSATDVYNDIIAFGDTSAQIGFPDVNDTSHDLIAMGNHALEAGNNISDIIGIGDHAISSVATSNNIISSGFDTIGNLTASHDVIANGHTIAWYNGFDLPGDSNWSNVIAQGFNVLNTPGITSLTDVICEGDGTCGSVTGGSNIIALGKSAGPTGALDNVINIGENANSTIPNETVIGNSSIASLKLFGCPSGQAVYDDGSGTCYVPGSLDSGLQTQIVNYSADGRTGGPTLITTDAATRKNLTVPRVLTGQVTNGNLNTDTYSATTGVTTALASADCQGTGCTFNVPETSTDTEQIPPTMVSRNVPYTHGADDRFALDTHTYYNAGNNNVGSSGVRWVGGHNYFWNDQPTVPNQRIEADFTHYISSGAGVAFGERSPLPTLFNWTLTHAHNTTMWDWTRGIGQVYPATLNCYKVGDCMLQEQYLNWRSGATIDSDEGEKATSYVMTQQPSPYGTITQGGANATVVNSSFTNNGNQADGMNLVSTSEVMDSFLVTGQGSQGGILPNYLTTSNTHTVSTAIGVLTANCGANTVRNAPASATCSITLSSGSFTANAGDTVCVGDVHYDEQAAITAASSTSLTLNLTYAHPTGTPIYQGGGCGGKAVWGYGLADPSSNHNFVSFEIVGSRTASTYDYVIEAFGGGTNPLPTAVIPVIPPVSFTSLSRVGNLVTATISGAANSGAAFNSFVAPGTSTLQITGATPSDLNGIVTNVHSTPGKMTWTQTGADESGTGGTLGIVGYNNMSVYCGAQTTKIDGVGMDATGSATVSGGKLEVEANNCAWPVGQTITQSNQTNVFVTGQFMNINGTTPPFQNPVHGYTLTMSGAQASGAIALNFANADQLNTIFGFGGTILPHTLVNSSDYYGTMFNFRNPPLDSGSMFLVGCPVEGCVSTAYDYNLFTLSGLGGTSQLSFSPSKNIFTFTSPVGVGGYAYATQAVGVSNTYAGAQGSVPGVPGMGGYFEAVGQPVDDNNTLCAGNGLVGDCSGSVGATRLIGANVIAGVNTPTTLNVTAAPSGSTSYTYKCTATTANGETTPITLTIGNGPATLSGSTYNNVKCPAVPGATGIKIYRTAGGPSTGLIKTLTNIAASDNGTVAFNDTGLAGDSSVPPSVNTTGAETVYGLLTASSIAATSGTINGSTICTVASPCVSYPIDKGRATLVAGTVTVTTTHAATTANYQLTNCGVGGTQGMLSVGTVSASTSFVINSSSATDTSVVCWVIQ